jgi:hypothetical protein
MIVALIRESSQLRGEDQADSQLLQTAGKHKRLASSQTALCGRGVDFIQQKAIVSAWY